MKVYIRRITAVLTLITALIFVLLSISCSAGASDSSFTVKFLSLTDGDSFMLNFPDGKVMLIDTGDGTEYSNDLIKSSLKEIGASKIDYLLLSHPDTTHYLGTESVLSEYKIDKAYIPNISNLNALPKYNGVITSLTDSGTIFENPLIGKYIVGENYKVAFLSPNYSESINEFTESKLNNLSPIIYIEILGVRFIFSGDADISQERFVVDCYKTSTYNILFKKIGGINLSEIDFMLLGDGGSANATSDEYLKVIKPKNAVISVSKNLYSSVSSATLSRLSNISPNVNILRTDINGSIRIKIDNNKAYEIKTGETI